MSLPNKIETKRLNIYPMSEKFVNEMFDNFNDEVTKFMSDSPLKSVEQNKDFIEIAISKNNSGKSFQAFFTDKKDRWLGNCSLYKINTDTPEFGLWVKKSAHGKGFGLEAATALKNWADKNLDYKYIIYQVADINNASINLVKKLGGIKSDAKTHNPDSDKNLNWVEYKIYSK